MKIVIVVERNPDSARDDWEWTAYRKGTTFGAGGYTKEQAVRGAQAMELRVLAGRLDLENVDAVDTIEFVVVES